jgi:4-hydroxybenzoate polyprenyltransferase
VAAVPLIIGYPLAKRFFPVPQLVLSLAWGFAVLICWSAVTHSLNTNTFVLWGAVIFWTLGFDTIYALSDQEDDLKVGINSSAIFFGKYAPEAVGVFFALTVGLLAWEGQKLQLSAFFWVGLAIAAIVWLNQYRLLRQSDLPKPVYGQMFGQNVWIGFILLAGMITGSLY